MREKGVTGEMSSLDESIEKPLYLSPKMVIGADPSGQLLAIIKSDGEPNAAVLSLMNRAVELCELDYLEEPFYFDNKWHCKLKERE
jgi:hypothetical protein